MMNIKDFNNIRSGRRKNLVYVKAVVIGYCEDDFLDSVAVGLIDSDGKTVAFYVNADQITIPEDLA